MGRAKQKTDRAAGEAGSRAWRRLQRKRISNTKNLSVKSVDACKSAPVIAKPLTHVAAGMQIPDYAHLNEAYGMGEFYTNTEFLSEAGFYAEFFKVGIENDWLDKNAVESMLGNNRIGSPEQKLECAELLNKCIKSVQGEVLIRLSRMPSAINLNKLMSDISGWGYSYSPVLADFEYEEYFGEQITGATISDEIYGVSVMPLNISSLDDTIQGEVVELVSYCCQISRHAMPTDIINDERTMWTFLGELSELEGINDLETLRKWSDPAVLNDVVLGFFGNDIGDDVHNPEDLLETLSVVRAFAEHGKFVKSFSKTNVSGQAKRLRGIKSCPTWLLVALDTLLDLADWTIMDSDSFSYRGESVTETLRPVTFCDEYENSILENIHDVAMQGEIGSSILISYDADTPRVLSMQLLGELIIAFINSQIEMIPSVSE